MARLNGRVVLVAALARLPGAFRPDAPVPAPAPARHTLIVTAYEYTFVAPDSTTSGIVTIRLVNRGKEEHQATFARLDDSSSLPRVMRSLVSNVGRTGGVRWTATVREGRCGEGGVAARRVDGKGRGEGGEGFGTPARNDLQFVNWGNEIYER